MRVCRGRLYLGTSGWTYPHWGGGVFYPAGMPQSRWLEEYARSFDTVEVNYSFYRLPSVSAFAAWRERTPPGFIFAVKASRFLTHIKRLREPLEPMQRLVSRAEALGEKLGPILFQFPPNWGLSLERLEEFLALVAKQSWKLRLVFEFRNPEWLEDEVHRLLREHGAALCLADLHQEVSGPLTADFVYMRRHGPERRISYSSAELQADARQVRLWLDEGRDVYLYYNNDAGGAAVKNALAIRKWISP